MYKSSEVYIQNHTQERDSDNERITEFMLT